MADAGIEYAIALFELSKSDDKTEKVYDSLKIVKELLNDNTMYLSLLSSPAITKDERYKCIDEAFKDEDNYVINLLKTLVNNDDVNEFFDLFYHYEFLFNESIRVIDAKVISSVELDDSQKDKILKLLEEKENKKVQIKYLIDKDILGGIIIEIDGKRYDGSLKHKLHDIKKVMNDEHINQY